MITAEGLDPLTAAKYFLSKGSIGSIELEVGREYAERAFSENPNPILWRHSMYGCFVTIYHSRKPHSVVCLTSSQTLIAHRDYAGLLCYDLSRPGEGLVHIQKAIQLDRHSAL